MTVDAGTVEWLRQGARFEAATDAAMAAAWGEEAVEIESVSSFALAADAAAEAVRQQAFLKGPLAVEVHDVPGLRSDLWGRAVTISCDRLGYQAGLTVFVIGVEEAPLVSRSRLTVLRRLA